MITREEAEIKRWEARKREAQRIVHLATIIECSQTIRTTLHYACTTPDGLPREAEVNSTRLLIMRSAIASIESAVRMLEST